MKKLIYVFIIVFVTALSSSCEQEDIAPSEFELVDPEFTEGEGDEKDGGVKSS